MRTCVSKLERQIPAELCGENEVNSLPGPSESGLVKREYGLVD